MIKLTAFQEKVVGIVLEEKHRRVGCPANLIAPQTLELLISKDALKRGEENKEKIFIHPAYRQQRRNKKKGEGMEFSNPQLVAINFISKKDYRWCGCPAYLLNKQILKALINKGAVRRGVNRPSKVFANRDMLNKLKRENRI